MKLRTLIACCLFAMMAKAQNKEAEFQKVQELLKKSNGVVGKDLKIISQSFTDKTIRTEFLQDGMTQSIVCSGPDWDKFDYDVKEQKGDNIAVVSIMFDKEFDLTNYEGKKKIESQKSDEMLFFINAADAEAMDHQLEQLQKYTWKSLIEVRTADKAGLASFITKHLNKALKEEEGKIKSITECGLTIAFDGEEIAMPIKNLKLHEKEVLGPYRLCFGKPGAPVQTKTSSGTQTKTLEHPDMKLDFSYDPGVVAVVELAFQKLSSYCSQ